MCGFAVEGVPRKKTRCGLAGESGGGAGSAVEVENDSLTRVNLSGRFWNPVARASERASVESEPSDGRALPCSLTLSFHTNT